MSHGGRSTSRVPAEPIVGALARTVWLGVAALLALGSAGLAEDLPIRDDNARTATTSDRPRDARPSPKPETSKPTPPQVEEWPPSAVRALSLQSEKLSEAVFDLLEDIEMIHLHLGEGDLEVRGGRRVFDNHNVLGSWTVVDHLRIGLDYPFYTVSWPIVGNLTGGFSVGGSLGNDFVDIRQVLPEDFAHLPTIEDRGAESAAVTAAPPVESDLPPLDLPRENLPDTTVEPDAHPAAEAPQADAKSSWFHPFEGLTKARYGKLWNIIGFPVRIPTQAEWISHMKDGEIISFTARGTIDAGPSIGWRLGLSQVTDSVRADASIGVYVTGEFRISILREDARYVRVRITRLAEAGATATAGVHTDDVIRGFTVGNARIGRNKTAITPFSFTFSNGKGRSLDLVYRYDLNATAGRLAYERAVAGRFGLSEELAGGFEWQRMPPDAPVRKIGTRSSVYTVDTKSSGAHYGFFYRHNHDSRVTNSDISATFAEGTTRVFRSDTQNSQSWRLIWGTFERLNYSFRCNVDLDRYEQGEKDAITLVVQGEITDTDTTGDEMHRYMEEVETATQRPGFFPRPPRYRPDADFPRYRPDDGLDRRRADRVREHADDDIDYYRTSFFYQLTFSQEQIETFLSTPYERVWPALERAFDVPAGLWANAAKRYGFALLHVPERVLNLPMYAVNMHYRDGSMLEHARAIRTAWMEAKAQTSIVDKIAAMGRMFSDRRYGPELVRLLRVVLAGEKVAYVLQGSGHTFGYLHDEGLGTTASDPLPERKERRLDFDTEGPRPQADPEAAVRTLGCEIVEPGVYRVSFTLESVAKPLALYVSLIEIRPWKLPRTVAQQAYVGKAMTVAGGGNVVVVKPGSGFLSELFSKVEPGNEYILRMAYTRDGVAWGPLAETRFSVPNAADASEPIFGPPPPP